MIEQLVEKRIMEKIEAALAAANVSGIEVVGAWQVEDSKGIETADLGGIVAVRVNPREYQGYLTHDAALSCVVTLTVRAETDATSALRLAATDALTALLSRWHYVVEDVAADFAGIDGFDPVGFRLDGGDVGLDRASSAWNYSHNFTLRGVILK